MTTKAELDGDEWVLNGRKIFITNAEAADTYVVFARTGSKELKSKAFSTPVSYTHLDVYKRQFYTLGVFAIHLQPSFHREEKDLQYSC